MKQLRERIIRLLENGENNNIEEKEKREYLLKTKNILRKYCRLTLHIGNIKNVFLNFDQFNILDKILSKIKKLDI
jgi:hypothetical protein